MQATYDVPVPRYYELTEKIAQVNKKAAKVGAAAITLEVLGSDIRPAGKDENGREVFVTWYQVEVIGETPKFAGWTFAATLDPIVGGNVIRSVPGTPDAPVAYRTAAPTCDHCNLRRHRKDTFLVVNETGEWKQVGRQCISDFLGGADPHDIARMMGWLREIDELGTGGEGGFGSSSAVAKSSVFSALSWAAASIRQKGWTSRSVARDHAGLIATVDRVRSFWNWKPSKEQPIMPDSIRMEPPTDDDRLTAFATIQQWNADAGASDYAYNVKLVLSQGLIEPKQEGIAMSAVAGYLREVDRMVEREKLASRYAAVSEHLGAVGVRSVFEDVEVTHFSVREGDYGITTILTFIDTQGQVLKWFASGELGEAWLVGTKHTIAGTVKKHDVFRDRKETVLTRVSETAKGAKVKQAKSRQPRQPLDPNRRVEPYVGRISRAW